MKEDNNINTVEESDIIELEPEKDESKVEL